MYIACPKCDWRPAPEHKWQCTCGHQWHTFDTHGVCPACGKVWAETRCALPGGCGAWSDHEEWYHEDDGVTVADYVDNPALIRNVSPLPNPRSDSHENE